MQEKQNVFVTFEPDSSWIEGVIYHPDEQVLILKTKSDKLYKYVNVPEKLFTDWVLAESAGHFYHENIKDKYDYTEEKP
jgi:hypothetical protein